MSSQVAVTPLEAATETERLASWVAQIGAMAQGLSFGLRRACDVAQVAVQSASVLAESVPRVPKFAAAVCRPYQREIRKLTNGRIAPLSREEEIRFALSAILLCLFGVAHEFENSVRPPLEVVALWRGRRDIFGEALCGRDEKLVRMLRARRWNDRPSETDILAEIYEELGGHFADWVRDNLRELECGDAAEKLAKWLSKGYVRRVLKNAHLQRVQREDRQHEHIDSTVRLDTLRDSIPQEKLLKSVDVRRVLRHYLTQSKRPELDAAILQAKMENTPLAALSRELDIPVTTVKSRCEAMRKCLHDQLAR